LALSSELYSLVVHYSSVDGPTAALGKYSAECQMLPGDEQDLLRDCASQSATGVGH